MIKDFNFHNFDNKFHQIDSKIKRFYPVDVKIEELDEFLHPNSDANVQKRKLRDHLSAVTDFDLWSQLTNQLQKEFPDHTVLNSSNLQQPAYHGRVIVNTFNTKHLINVLRVDYAVSLLGPFYTIFGVDGIGIDRKGIRNSKNIMDCLASSRHSHTIYPSPNSLIEPFYSRVQHNITEVFSGFRQIPFNVLFSIFPDMRTDGEDKDRTVYQALFGGEPELPGR